MAIPFVFSHRHLGYQIGCGILLLATVLGIFGVVSPGWYRVEQTTTGKQYYSHLWIVCSEGLKGCRVLSSGETKGFEKAAQAFAVLGVLSLVTSCLLAVFLNFVIQNKGHNRWLEIAILVSGGLTFLVGLIFVAGNPKYIESAWTKFHFRVSNGYGVALTFVAAILTFTSGAVVWFFNRPLDVPSDQRSLSVLSRNDPVDRIHRETSGEGGGGEEDDDDGGFRNPALDVSEFAASPPDYRHFERGGGRDAANGVVVGNHGEVAVVVPRGGRPRGMRSRGANGVRSSEPQVWEGGRVVGRGAANGSVPSTDSQSSRPFHSASDLDRPRLLPPRPQSDLVAGGGSKLEVDLTPRPRDLDRDLGNDLDRFPRAKGSDRPRFQSGGDGRSRETSLPPQPRLGSEGEGQTGHEDNYYEDVSSGDLGEPTPSYFTSLNPRRSGAGFEPSKAEDDHVYSELRPDNCSPARLENSASPPPPPPLHFSRPNVSQDSTGYRREDGPGRRENVYGSRANGLDGEDPNAEKVYGRGTNGSDIGNTRRENAYGNRASGLDGGSTNSEKVYGNRANGSNAKNTNSENAYGRRATGSVEGNTRFDNAYGSRQEVGDKTTAQLENAYGSRQNNSDQKNKSTGFEKAYGTRQNGRNDGFVGTDIGSNRRPAYSHELRKSYSQEDILDDRNRTKKTTNREHSDQGRSAFENDYQRKPDYYNSEFHRKSDDSARQVRYQQHRGAVLPQSDENSRHRNDAPGRRHSYDAIGDADSQHPYMNEHPRYRNENEFNSGSRASNTTDFPPRNSKSSTQEMPRSVDSNRMQRHSGASRILRHSHDVMETDIDVPSGMPPPMYTEI